jgi:IS5 family transposase
MRHSVQLPLTAPAIDHEHAAELTAISEILDAEPRIARLVDQDLLRRCKKNASMGRPGLTGDQVLRMAIVRQMNAWTFEELAFHLADSLSYRTFCRVGFLHTPPSKATVAENIKLLRQETIAKINTMLVTSVEARQLDNGETVRIDSTVVRSPIHAPTDSSLLFDCVRTLVRSLRRVEKWTGFDCFHVHVKRAKRRLIEIQHAKPHEKHKRLVGYRDLLKLAEATVGYASCALEHTSSEGNEAVRRLRLDMQETIELTARVIDQTRRRIIDGETVPATEKVVSIFEPHTDVIVKDNRDTYYGHKIFLTGGKSGLVLDCAIVMGNAADSTWTVPMIERHKGNFGAAPLQASYDGAFASKENLAKAKELGVADVCFSKRRGIDVLDMVRESWIYKKLRNFRAGIESVISWLKRSFGLARCVWKSAKSFVAYVRIGVLTANLIVLARHRLA